jgi:hypothetical protein
VQFQRNLRCLRCGSHLTKAFEIRNHERRPRARARAEIGFTRRLHRAGPRRSSLRLRPPRAYASLSSFASEARALGSVALNAVPPQFIDEMAPSNDPPAQPFQLGLRRDMTGVAAAGADWRVFAKAIGPCVAGITVRPAPLCDTVWPALPAPSQRRAAFGRGRFHALGAAVPLFVEFDHGTRGRAYSGPCRRPRPRNPDLLHGAGL